MNREFKSVLRYIGGKYKMAPWIVSHFVPHKTYIEPFGGSAAVMLYKGKSRYEVEIYNDIWGLVVNFFRVLQASPEELLRRLEVMPYSRELHKYMHLQLKMLSSAEIQDLCNNPSVEWAAGFFYLNYTSVGSDVYGGFSTSPDYRAAERYRNHVAELQKVSKRFGDVIIESLHESELFRVYDRPDTFFYVDPPYDILGKVSNTLYGGLEWTNDKHVRLADQLQSLRGKWALSYYDTPLIRRLYPESKFNWKFYNTKRWNRKDGHGTTKSPASEVLILNY